MSLARPLLNAYLRRFEKPRLTRLDRVLEVRAGFERRARLFFRIPRGTERQWHILEAGQRRVEALEIVPADLRHDAVLFYIHGGAFMIGSPRTHAALLAELCRRLHCRAVLPRYRLAPEHPYPAAPQDIATAWQGLIASGVDPSKIWIGGDSAGGQLALSLLADLCAQGAPLPAGLFCFSPLTDMRLSSQSFRANAAQEAMLPSQTARQSLDIYLAGQSPEDPRLSPRLARFAGAPPAWICVGDTEILYDDACGMAEKLREEGAEVTLVQGRDLPHVWPMFKDVLPEARQTLEDLTQWFRRQPGWPGES